MTDKYVKVGGSGAAPTADPDVSGWGGAYPDIDTALAASTDGDRLLVSDAHTKAYGATVTYDHGGSYGGAGVAIVSVSDADKDVYSAGADEDSNGGTYDIVWDAANTFQSYGVDYSVGDDLRISAGTNLFLSDSTITSQSNGDHPLTFGGDGSFAHLENVDINFGGTGSYISPRYGCLLRWVGGSVDSAGSAPATLFTSMGDNGGCIVELTGVDLSHVTGTLVGTEIASAAGDTMLFTFRHCTLGSGVTVSAAPVGAGKRIELYNCDDTSGNVQYRFHVQDASGVATSETTIKRDESTALSYDDSTKLTIKVETEAVCSKYKPFIIEIPVQFSDLATASTDNVRVFFACPNSVDTSEIYFQLIYPDGTNASQPNFVGNAPGGGAFLDPQAAGAVYTDDSGSSTWKNGAGDLSAHSEYRADLDTSGDVASKGVPILRVYCCKASETFYIDSEFELVSG